MTIFIQGLIMGFAYVAPIGVQNLFVINTAATQTKKRALTTALIVSFFDISLAFACFFGIGALMNQANWLRLIILLVGSIIIMFIGIGLIRNKDMETQGRDVNIPIIKVISTACVVTWFNPQALIDGSMMLGAFRATLPPDKASFFILGVTSASLLWFFTVSFFVSLFKSKFSPKIMRGINVVCGAIILFYGAKLLYQFITSVFAHM